MSYYSFLSRLRFSLTVLSCWSSFISIFSAIRNAIVFLSSLWGWSLIWMGDFSILRISRIMFRTIIGIEYLLIHWVRREPMVRAAEIHMGSMAFLAWSLRGVGALRFGCMTIPRWGGSTIIRVKIIAKAQRSSSLVVSSETISIKSLILVTPSRVSTAAAARSS